MQFVHGANSSALRDRFIHRAGFKLSLNNEAICAKDTFLLILVNSDPENTEAREIIRETWGSVKSYNGSNIRVVFLIGTRQVSRRGSVTDLNARLKKESETFGDVIKGDFIDAYVNMTYKTVMGLHWMNLYCPKASFVMKSDDDVMINIRKVIHFLQEISQSESDLTNFFYCLTVTSTPFRERTSKWYVSYTDYKYTFYPTYCAGAGYIISNEAAVKVYEASTKVPYFWIDDVFIGFCAELAKIRLTNNYFGYYFIVPHSIFDAPWDFSVLKVIGRNREEMHQIWTYLNSVRTFHSMAFYRILVAFLVTSLCLLICFAAWGAVFAFQTYKART